MGQGSATPGGPHLAVYLIHFAAPEWCASSVRSVLGSRAVTPEVTVVDNGDAADLPATLPAGVHVIGDGTNRGFAGGANMAIADWRQSHAPGDYLVIGSHDLHVEEDALRRLVEAAADHPDFGVLAPLVAGREHRLDGPSGDRTVMPVTWVSGTCMLLRRDCLDRIGGFDSAFGSYVEDVDLCRRAYDAGWLTGVVLDSRASGLGSAHEQERDVSTEVNSVLLSLRRDGRFRAAFAVAGLAARSVRSLGGICVPGRTGELRRRSRYTLEVRLTALKRIAEAVLRGRWKRRFP